MTRFALLGLPPRRSCLRRLVAGAGAHIKIRPTAATTTAAAAAAAAATARRLPGLLALPELLKFLRYLTIQRLDSDGEGTAAGAAHQGVVAGVPEGKVRGRFAEGSL